MSKSIRKIASIALPIAASFIPGVGPLGIAAAGALGGAIGGGGIKGALMGGITSYLGSSAGPIAGITGAATAGAGTAAGAAAAGKAALMSSAPSIFNTGVGGAVTRALSSIPTSQLLNAASGIIGDMNAETAEEAARKQREGIQAGMQAQTAALQPYTQMGAEATKRIGEIEADPAGYIANNPLYKSLAEDAERRLLANQAAKGKVGSGGTAAALQEQLLNLGTGLVNNDVSRLSNQAGMGGNAAAQVGSTAYNGSVAIGDANAAGTVGANNAMTSTYQNQINTILAQMGMNKAPTYAPAINL